jgi:hypothetical protein
LKSLFPGISSAISLPKLKDGIRVATQLSEVDSHSLSLDSLELSLPTALVD